MSGLTSAATRATTAKRRARRLVRFFCGETGIFISTEASQNFSKKSLRGGAHLIFSALLFARKAGGTACLQTDN
jgi:hypothetical protein